MNLHMNRGFIRLLCALLVLPWLGACSTGQLVARSSVSIMDGSVDAMNRETDLDLARTAIPANLKLMEGLINEDPDNAELLTYAAQGFYGYAFGFVELDQPARAAALYARGYAYGKRALQALGLQLDLDHAGVDELEQALQGLGDKAVPALFWTASCWAKQIDLQRDDPARIAQLASSERLMRRVLQLQPDFYHGGVYLYFGVYYGGRSPLLGGDPQRAARYFEQARAVTGGRLLMVDVLQAEYLERQRLDRERFHRLLSRVVATPVGVFPQMALANQVARVRAERLLQHETEWF